MLGHNRIAQELIVLASLLEFTATITILAHQTLALALAVPLFDGIMQFFTFACVTVFPQGREGGGGVGICVITVCSLN